MAVVVTEASAKGHITSNPDKYIAAFETFIPDDYSKQLWQMFIAAQKSDYIRWFFNEGDSIYGTDETLNKNRLLTLLNSYPDTKDIFLDRFPDKKFNPDNPTDITAMTALNVYKKAVEILESRRGGSRRRRQRTRKYKKSKRIFRSKNRQTRRR